MGIKIYISGNSGNKEIVTHQQRIFMILKSLGIEFEPADIAAPGMENERDFMRKHAKKKDGDRNVLPPQIFNDDNYCGDYDDFDLANEDDELEEFLGLPRVTPKSIPVYKKGGGEEPQRTPAAHNGETERPQSENEDPNANPDASPADAASAEGAAAEAGTEAGETTTAMEVEGVTEEKSQPAESSGGGEGEGGGGGGGAEDAPAAAADDAAEAEGGDDDEYEYEDEGEGEQEE